MGSEIVHRSTDQSSPTFSVSILKAYCPQLLQANLHHTNPEKSIVIHLTEYQPETLTLTIITFFERLIITHINTSLLDNLSPLQFVYRKIMSVEGTITLQLHSSLGNLDSKNTYCRDDIN